MAVSRSLRSFFSLPFFFAIFYIWFLEGRELFAQDVGKAGWDVFWLRTEQPTCLLQAPVMVDGERGGRLTGGLGCGNDDFAARVGKEDFWKGGLLTGQRDSGRRSR